MDIGSRHPWEQLRYAFAPEVASPVRFFRALRALFWWLAPSALSVFSVHLAPPSSPAAYMKKAAEEGLGPHLWNVTGALGLGLLGLSLLLPRSRPVAEGASNVLMTTFGIGALMGGILIGQLAHAALDGGLSIGAVLGMAFLLVLVLTINALFWMLSDLVNTRSIETGFLHRWGHLSLRVRAFTGGILLLLVGAAAATMQLR